MTRRCGSSKPAHTPLPCEVMKPQEKRYGRRPRNVTLKTGNGLHKTQQRNGGINRRNVSYRFPQANAGSRNTEHKKEARKHRKRNASTKTMGSKAEYWKISSAKPRAVAKAYQIPPKLNRMIIPFHSAGATSKPSGELSGQPPHENNVKKTEKRMSPEEPEPKTGKPGSNTRARWRHERQLAISTPRDSSTVF